MDKKSEHQNSDNVAAVSKNIYGDHKTMKMHATLNKVYKVFPKRFLFALIVIIVGVICMVVVLSGKTVNSQAVCTNSIINQAVDNFRQPGASQFLNRVKTIQSLPHYKADPNCMYILAVYYLKIANVPKAQNSINLLKKDNVKELNAKLSSYLSLNELINRVLALTTAEQADASNTAALSPPSLNMPKYMK